MRINKRLSALALVAVAAGLSLTACNPASGTSSSSSSAAAGQGGSSGSGSSSSTSGGSGSSNSASSDPGSSNSGSGSASGSTCQTSNLTISAHHGLSDEGQEIIELKNIGSSSCTMHGFPGVDLQGSNASDGTISASRSNSDVPTVKLAPGEGTQAVLNYPFNNSGGTGFTFTKLIVTPPNETHSKTVSASINIPVDNPDQPKNGGITINAVGSGK
jgi:hypothetical protein